MFFPASREMALARRGEGVQTYGLPRPELVAIVARGKLVGYRRSIDECTRSARSIGRDSVAISARSNILGERKGESGLVLNLSKIP